jgi:hypothetical protein
MVEAGVAMPHAEDEEEDEATPTLEQVVDQRKVFASHSPTMSSITDRRMLRI